MDPNTLNCVIAIGVLILIVILVWGIVRFNARREKKDSAARMKARQLWTDDYQDRKDATEKEQDQT
jgi:hypothetical protein